MSIVFCDKPGSAGRSTRNAAVSARVWSLRFSTVTLPRVVVFVVLIFAPLVVSSAASAHVGFDRSEPGEGETVEGPLDELTLVFSGQVEPVGEKFAVLDPVDGLRTPTSVESSDGMTWVLGFDRPLGAGQLAVRWTVQSEDAHAITGGMTLNVLPAPVVEDDEPAGDSDAVAEQAQLAANGDNSATDVETSVDVEDDPAKVAEDVESDGQLRSVPVDGDSDGGSIDVGLAEIADGRDEAAEVFIADGRSRLAGASFVGAIGRAIGYTAAMAAIGGFLFAQLVLRRRRDLENAVVWLRRFGVFVLIGSGLEVVAQVVIEVGEWSFAGLVDLLASSFGLSVGLRFLGGLAWWGLPEPDLAGTEKVAAELNPSAKRQLSPMVSVVGSQPPNRPTRIDRSRDIAETFTEYRWQSGASSSLAILGLLLLTVSHLFDGHTLSEGNRLLTSFASAVHVVGGAVWAGGVIMLAATLWNRRRDRMPLEAMELGIRFSVLASVAAVVVGVAGIALTWSILDSTSSLWTTPWGRLLLIKLAVVALAGVMGLYNHRTLLPSAVQSRSVVGSSPDGVRLRMAVGVEALVMVTVVVITALLVGAAS